MAVGSSNRRTSGKPDKSLARANLCFSPDDNLSTSLSIIDALENPDVIDVPPSLLSPKNYVLQVKGDSMIDENIQDGDFIVVRRANTASPGQIIVALVNDEATLKCYVPKENHIELHPKNPSFPIIKVNSKDNFHINGVLLYSFRNYLI